MARRAQRAPRRKTHWENGATNLCLGFEAANASAPPIPLHTIILGTGTSPLMQTITRIVGELDVWVNTDDTDFLSAVGSARRSWYVVNAGIQIVNRADGAAGIPRDPDNADDREGGEWLWMRHYAFGWHTYTDTSTTALASWFVPMWNVGGYDPHIDIRVKRKLDHQQDDLVLSLTGVNCLDDSVNMNFSASLNLRCLVMDP